MHLTSTILFLFLTSITFAQLPSHHIQKNSRILDAILIEPQEPSPSPEPTPFLQKLDLRNAAPTIPFIKHLDLRQVAAPQQAAQPAAGAQQQAAKPAANANANANGAAQPAAGGGGAKQKEAAAPAPNAQAPVAPAPVAPVAGVGGGGAPAQAQPLPGAQANPVTTAQVQTVVGGVTKMIPTVYTQSFGVGASAPSVKTGSIGMGTLTGKIGVIKTDSPKSDAMPIIAGMSRRWAMLGIIGSWVMAMGLGGIVVGLGMI